MENKGWKRSDFKAMRPNANYGAAEEVDELSQELSQRNEKYTLLEHTAQQYKFKDFCQRLEATTKISERQKKYETLLSPKLAKELYKKSVFPLARLILPDVDTCRGLFNIKHKSIASIYVKLLTLENSEDADRLLNWRDPSKGGVYGEFTEVLYNVLQTRVTDKWSNKTIGETNAILDRLVQAVDSEDRLKIFQNCIFKEFSAIEQKWLMRVIVQDMKLGVKHDGLLKYLGGEKALEYFSSCCDLRKTCFAISNPAQLNQQSSRICVGQPFTPMLAKGHQGVGAGGQLDKCEASMRKKKFVMDIKLDGERMLCHKDGNTVRWFTRRANEYTSIYGPVMNQFIVDNVMIERCVLDGEMVAYDSGSSAESGGQGGLIPFGSNRTVAADEIKTRETGQTSSKWLFFIVFDVLHASGDGASKALKTAAPLLSVMNGDITGWPLASRRRLLQGIVEEVPRRLEFVKCEEVGEGSKESRCAALAAFFNRAVETGQEGLVVKDLSSPYLIGEKSRAKSHWVKMKPEYSDQTANLDVCIVGGYYGDGTRRRGLLSHFLLAVVDQDTVPEDGSEPIDVNKTKWYTMGKVGTGYSVQDLQELNDRIRPHAKDYEAPSSSNMRGRGSAWPAYLHKWTMKHDDIPDVFIAPNHSVIMEIKCSELVVTDQFSAGKTPRFPRCVNIRYDKAWYESMTQKELLEIKRDAVIGAEDAGGGQARRLAKKKKVVSTGLRVIEGMEVISKKEALKGKTLTSNMFEGYTFSVIPWDGARTIPAMNGLLLPWSKRSNKSNGGGSYSTQTTQSTQSLSQLTQGDLVGLEPEEAARIAEMRTIRSKKLTTRDLQILLYENGAYMLVGAAKTEGVDYIVALNHPSTKDPGDNNTPDRARNLVAYLSNKPHESCDVITAAWVYDSIVAGVKQPKHFEYMLHACQETKDEIRTVCDQYGDRYLEESTTRSLKRVFQQVELQHPSRPWQQFHQARSKTAKRPSDWKEIASELLLEEQDAMDTEFTIFWRSLLIYVDCYETIGDIVPTSSSSDAPPRAIIPFSSVSAAQHSLRLFSASISDQLHYNVTHVLVDPDQPERFHEIKQRIREIRVHPNSNYSGVRIVTPAWVNACIQEKCARPPHFPEETVVL